MPESTTITNVMYGFALQLPVGWREVPPEVTASPWQVAAFRDESGEAYAGVLLAPTHDRPAHEIVEAQRAAYEASGVEALDSRPTPFAGHDGHRLEGRRGRFSVLEYVAVLGDRSYRLALRTEDVDRDRTTLDEIAESFRITDAAAPMPYVPQRPALTDRARNVLVAAAQAAETHSSPPSTAHLLYAMAAAEDGVAAIALRNAGLDLDATRAALARVSVGTAAAHSEGTDDLKELVVEVAPTVARELGHYYIGTEHLLLAVLGTDNPGSALAREMGLDFGAVRASVAELLTAHLTDRITQASGS